MQNWLMGRSNTTWGMQSKVRTGLTLCGLAILFLMLSTVSAVAQLSGKGQITGVVTDKTGAVIPGAEVTATSAATGIKTAGKTNGAGIYTFSALDPGLYTLEISAQGFESLKQENIHVNAMESVGYNPALDVAGAAPVEITVTGEPPQLETSNATLGSTMEQESYSELPVEMGAYGQADQRRATDFAFLMPGVQGNNTTGNATTNTGIVNGSGSKGAASDVYIDGIPFVRAGGNGDPRFVWTAISVDAIDQFQVQTNGYSAIYEGQGVMNYSVKGGGNQYHGSGYEFIRNTALDTWGFWGKAPITVNNVQVVQKPAEHSNEYGINISGPLVPYGKLKDKLFFFENYNGFRYSSTTPTAITMPTYAQQGGDFSNSSLPLVYNPYSVNTTTNQRAQFVSTSGTKNVIPSTYFSSVAKALQADLPTTGIGTALQNNFLAPNATNLNNWSTTSRVDYVLSANDSFSVVGAVGRQASGATVVQTTSGRGVGPVPYNYGQGYAPKTAVWTLEETHTFNSNLLNQIKWGYARYNGPTFNPDYSKTYAASTMGITFGNAPAGQAANAFPIVTFSGTDAPTQWNGTTAGVTIAQNYTVLDNLQWNHGKHSITFGGQIAWLLYNTTTATGGSTPVTLATTNTETAQFASSSGTSVTSSTGYSYASFLLGQFDKASFTDYNYHPGYGARFRAMSPYVQDDWKVSSKLTVNAGLRYDFYPSVREVNDDASFFNPKLANSVTGLNGALQFAGYGSNACNCHSPVNNYYKNFGPRVGAAYQLDSKTVVRGSFGIMFSHGDAVGGNASSLGTLGFSAGPSWSSASAVTNSSLGFTYNTKNTVSIPTYTTASGAASGATYGTGYTNTSGYTGTPSSMGYIDPYLGSRAPEYVNWSFGVQRQLTNTIALNVTYVGSEGHFLQMDGSNARGTWADQLDPKYLFLGARLADTGTSTTTVTADCSNSTYTSEGLSCNSTALGNFSTSQALSTLLKPFPFQTVGDSFDYVGNASYNALQAVASLRNWKGLTGNVSYTLARSIDDAGYFRAGYAIPTTYIYNATGGSYVDNKKIERTVSSSNQPQHLVVTAVYKEPLGKTYLASNRYERMLLGGYTVSGIFQAYSGSPLAVTMSTCNTNPAESSSFCPASYNPNYSGNPRINGKWGKGVTATSYSKSFIDSNAFVSTPAYEYGNLPRMAPYNLRGPGNYQLDLSASRSFPLHILAGSKLDIKAQWYNVTNHTQFAVASTAFGSTSFGQVTTNTSANRKAGQFTARISF
ncbi:carboxypeptidase regulatory-like domain-containing protein [Telmatobacter bradus]|uniref:TonB-dependent receptor n=1 Tax=Telmatobacter bradus TaxID=474953 RepID=UPI003B43696E